MMYCKYSANSSFAIIGGNQVGTACHMHYSCYNIYLQPRSKGIRMGLSPASLRCSAR